MYDILRSVATIWDSRLKIELAALFPIAVAHQQRREIPIDDDIGANLQRLAQRNSGKREWKIPIVLESYQRPAQSVDGITLASDFFAHARRPLSKLNYEVASAYSRWVVERLDQEFSLAHGSRYKMDDPPYSTILRYPEMVRTAGRLLPQSQIS